MPNLINDYEERKKSRCWKNAYTHTHFYNIVLYYEHTHTHKVQIWWINCNDCFKSYFAHHLTHFQFFRFYTCILSHSFILIHQAVINEFTKIRAWINWNKNSFCWMHKHTQTCTSIYTQCDEKIFTYHYTKYAIYIRHNARIKGKNWYN